MKTIVFEARVQHVTESAQFHREYTGQPMAYYAAKDILPVLTDVERVALFAEWCPHCGKRSRRGACKECEDDAC